MRRYKPADMDGFTPYLRTGRPINGGTPPYYPPRPSMRMTSPEYPTGYSGATWRFDGSNRETMSDTDGGPSNIWFNQAGPQQGLAAPQGYPTCASTQGQCPCSYGGCMDPSSFNYDPNATCDDGSCVAVAQGCTDPNSTNFDPSANTDDGSCYTAVSGCTDPNAANYNPLANTDCSGAYLGGPVGPLQNQGQQQNQQAAAFSGYSNFNTGFTPNPNAPMTISTSHHLSMAGKGTEWQNTGYSGTDWQEYSEMAGTGWQQAGYSGTSWQEEL